MNYSLDHHGETHTFHHEMSTDACLQNMFWEVFQHIFLMFSTDLLCNWYWHSSPKIIELVCQPKSPLIFFPISYYWGLNNHFLPIFIFGTPPGLLGTKTYCSSLDEREGLYQKTLKPTYGFPWFLIYVKRKRYSGCILYNKMSREI